MENLDNKGHNPKVYLFYCSTNTNVAETITSSTADVKAIPVPCSGKIDILYLTKAFETGAEGIAILTCKQNDCRYLEGNLRAARRADFVGSLIEEIGLDKGRIQVISAGNDDTKQALNALENFQNRIKTTSIDFTATKILTASKK